TPNGDGSGYTVTATAVCRYGGESYTFEAVSDLVQHTAPTCTESGRNKYEARFDDVPESYGVTRQIRFFVIPALGHDYVVFRVSEPTCTQGGKIYYLCTRCFNHTYEYIDQDRPLGHDFSEEWTVDVEPTETTPGSKSRHCTRCGEVTDVTEIPPLVTVLRGDANCDGKFTAKDLSLVKRVVAGGAEEGAYNAANADVNGDGKYTNKDVSMLKRIIAGA
ncbi:MAG: dockerin type I repeat-containing protein, partial [Clostridia bacterium]|nr:dockerin type I repeat-containing protein [Clostridia bacterium]